LLKRLELSPSAAIFTVITTVTSLRVGEQEATTQSRGTLKEIIDTAITGSTNWHSWRGDEHIFKSIGRVRIDGDDGHWHGRMGNGTRFA
jgi:hypothetical protein